MVVQRIDLPATGVPEFTSGEITFIGTATVLVRYAGFTILTDPNFLHQGDHAKLGYGLRSKRLTNPALEIAQLPPLDFVVLSHHHGDHFDEIAARDLDKAVPIITTPHAARKLTRQGFTNARPLQNWQSQVVTRGEAQVSVTSTPGKHAPQPLGALLPSVMGSVLEFGRVGPSGPPARAGDLAPAGGAGPAGGASPAVAGAGPAVAGVAPPLFRLYITGDTLVHDRLREIPERYPDLDLTLIHLGGTKVLGILLTMDAAQGVRALQIIKPKAAVPIHFDDYTVFKSPLEDFKAAVARASLPTQVHYVDHGGTHRFQVPTSR